MSTAPSYLLALQMRCRASPPKSAPRNSLSAHNCAGRVRTIYRSVHSAWREHNAQSTLADVPPILIFLYDVYHLCRSSAPWLLDLDAPPLHTRISKRGRFLPVTDEAFVQIVHAACSHSNNFETPSPKCSLLNTTPLQTRRYSWIADFLLF